MEIHWRWVWKRLPQTRNGESLLDVGCGTGAFTIGAALQGYDALVLSWDERNQRVAAERARACGVDGESGVPARSGRARFDVLDVRCMDSRPDLRERFDVALCCECAEHILNDRKLLRDVFDCLKPGGRLIFSSPNYYYRAMSAGDLGPFCKEETGWHVRRGYSPEMLRELCEQSGLRCEEIGFCSGVVSQKITAMLRAVGRFHYKFAWACVLPLRPFVLLDGILSWFWKYPGYSICMVAIKGRYGEMAQDTK